MKPSYETLLKFYEEVANITIAHSSIRAAEGRYLFVTRELRKGKPVPHEERKHKDATFAVVFPSDLGPALDRVSKMWWKGPGQFKSWRKL